MMLMLGPKSMRRDCCPIDYRMCNQTVTVYHNEGGTITRTVHENAFFEFKKTRNAEKTGSREANAFLLVIPGAVQTVFVGDKVLKGRGRDVYTREEWASLIPSKVPGLAVVSYADPKYWGDRLVHTEAGG